MTNLRYSDEFYISYSKYLGTDLFFCLFQEGYQPISAHTFAGLNKQLYATTTFIMLVLRHFLTH